MTSSRIFIDPLLTRKSLAYKLKTNSLWDGLYSMTIYKLYILSTSLYT